MCINAWFENIPSCVSHIVTENVQCCNSVISGMTGENFLKQNFDQCEDICRSTVEISASMTIMLFWLTLAKALYQRNVE